MEEKNLIHKIKVHIESAIESPPNTLDSIRIFLDKLTINIEETCLDSNETACQLWVRTLVNVQSTKELLHLHPGITRYTYEISEPDMALREIPTLQSLSLKTIPRYHGCDFPRHDNTAVEKHGSIRQSMIAEAVHPGKRTLNH
jgi:hypothetical protein